MENDSRKSRLQQIGELVSEVSEENNLRDKGMQESWQLLSLF